MSVEHTTGLVLRTMPFMETSLIVRWLTPTFGRLSTIAKGARRPRSPFRGKLDLYYECALSFHRSRRSTLHILREVVVHDMHPALREDFQRLSQVAYCALWIERVTEEETPVPRFHAMLQDLIGALSTGPQSPLSVLSFEVRLLAESGLEPDWPGTGLDAAAQRLGRTLRESGFRQASLVEASSETVAELSRFLHGFLEYHLGRVPPDRQRALSPHISHAE